MRIRTKSHRVTRGAAAVGLALLVAVGCASASLAGGTRASLDHATTLYVDIDSGKPADPKNFNPYGASTTNDGGLSQVLFEPLFEANPLNGKVTPWLGKSMTTKDRGKTWTLSLQKGITWSDGMPFTAADVIFTIKMIQKYPDLNTPNKFPGMTLKQVDPQTVKITLKTPDPRLILEGFSSVLPSKELYIVPQHIWASVKNPATFTNYDPSKGWPVATGPYKLSNAGVTSFTWTEDPNYWGAKTGFASLPAPQTIVYEALGPEETRASAMAQNDLDVGASFSIGALQSLTARNHSVQAWSTAAPYGYSDICLRSLDFQTEKAPWSSPQLRWAVDYAIDRSKVINVAYQGASSPALTMLPNYTGLTPYVNALIKTGVMRKYPVGLTSQARARKLIEGQGYTMSGGTYQKDGQKLSLTISTYQDPTIESIAQTVAQQLTQVGISASVNAVAIPAFIKNLLSGNFQANLFFGACGSTIDPWQSMDAFNVSHYVQPSASAAGFYSNTFRWNTSAAKQYSDVVDKIGKLGVNAPAIQPLFVKAMKLFYSELPSIPLVQNPLINPVNSTNWTGWPTSKNPYIEPEFAGPAMVVVLHRIKSAH